MKREARACRRKVRYSNPLAAMRTFIKVASNGFALTLGIYQCEVCGGLHLGNSRFNRRTTKAEQENGKRVIARLIARMT